MCIIYWIAVSFIYAAMTVCVSSEPSHNDTIGSISDKLKNSTEKSPFRRRIDVQSILQAKNKNDGKRGPKRGKNYDPSIGFEPYWENGDWVFDWFHELTKKNESKGLCVPKCLPLYERYGKICGRNKLLATKTFENYCELVKLDCDGRAGWAIVYRGECRSEPPVYPTMPSSTTSDFQSMATYFIEEFSKRHPNLK